MPTPNRIIIKNKTYGIAQGRGYYEVYRFIRNMNGEILAYVLVGTFKQFNEALNRILKRGNNGKNNQTSLHLRAPQMASAKR